MWQGETCLRENRLLSIYLELAVGCPSQQAVGFWNESNSMLTFKEVLKVHYVERQDKKAELGSTVFKPGHFYILKFFQEEPTKTPLLCLP